MLAMRSLTMFPAAFPQQTELIMGRPVSDAKFQRERVAFLKKFAVAFQPAVNHHKKSDFEGMMSRMKNPFRIFHAGVAAALLAAAVLAGGCSHGRRAKASRRRAGARGAGGRNQPAGAD